MTIIQRYHCYYFTPCDFFPPVLVDDFLLNNSSSLKLFSVFWLVFTIMLSRWLSSSSLLLLLLLFVEIVIISCLNFWDEACWFLSLRVFGLLSSSSLLFLQRFGSYVLRPSSGVCQTWEPPRNFELRPLLKPRGSTNTWRRPEDISAKTLWK